MGGINAGVLLYSRMIIVDYILNISKWLEKSIFNVITTRKCKGIR
jgi:hypothetical protein